MNVNEHCEIASSPFVATQAVSYTEVGGGRGLGNNNGYLLGLEYPTGVIVLCS